MKHDVDTQKPDEDVANELHELYNILKFEKYIYDKCTEIIQSNEDVDSGFARRVGVMIRELADLMRTEPNNITKRGTKLRALYAELCRNGYDIPN